MSDECRKLTDAYGLAAGVRFVTAAIASLLLIVNGLEAKETLVLLDGKRLEAEVQSIDAKTGQITAAGLEQPVELQGLRSLARPAQQVTPIAGAFSVRLAGGGELLAKALKVADEKVNVTSSYGDASLSLEVVRALVFASDNKAADRPEVSDQGKKLLTAALALPPGEKDSLLIVVEGKVQTITGLVSEWKTGGVTFDWEGQSREIPYSRIYGVVLAQLGPAHDATGECTVATTDGSTITGRVSGLANSKLAVAIDKNTNLSIPWDAVRSISIKSDRLVYLSDLKPVDAQTRPVVTLPRPWQADRGVMGGPLTLGEQKFDKGLGVMSRTQLVFSQPTGFDVLSATIGLDASAQGRGNCEFVVLVDGREMFREAMTGKTAAKEIRVPTAGAQRVSLIVEPGEDLDLSDHADWCDARFLKAGKEASK